MTQEIALSGLLLVASGVALAREAILYEQRAGGYVLHARLVAILGAAVPIGGGLALFLVGSIYLALRGGV